jgi:hypothetical protein
MSLWQYFWRVVLLLLTLFAASNAPQVLLRAFAASPAKPALDVKLSSDAAQPRQVEDTTENAIVRDYSAAWKSLENSLAQNRDDQLGANFAGSALDQLKSRLESQRKNGLHTRLIDRGHKLEAIFYSPEGSAMQLRDTAQLEIQVLDGGNVIHSEQATLHYIALMTTAEDRWKVRLLEEVQ